MSGKTDAPCDDGGSGASKDVVDEDADVVVDDDDDDDEYGCPPRLDAGAMDRGDEPRWTKDEG
jgi:hypothetical protein